MTNLMYTAKLSAIHNLCIQAADAGGMEGLLVPKEIMLAADLHEYEQIIVTKIHGNSFANRIRTIVFSNDSCKKVTVCGSLSKFLNVGELTCLISETVLDESMQQSFANDEWPIFDLGFNPETNTDNSEWRLELQYCNKEVFVVNHFNINEVILARKELLRKRLSALILNMKINKTHPDCLHGSAEIPASVLCAAHVKQYRSVSVYNVSEGGLAETYAVAMPEGTVMTTGAMASFAKLGDYVNIAAFDISSSFAKPHICYTDGIRIKEQ